MRYMTTFVAAAAVFAVSTAAQAEPFSASAVASTAAKAWYADRVAANQKDNNEKTAVGRALKGPTGISVDAIKKDGIFGGKNSVFRKPFG